MCTKSFQQNKREIYESDKQIKRVLIFFDMIVLSLDISAHFPFLVYSTYLNYELLSPSALGLCQHHWPLSVLVSHSNASWSPVPSIAEVLNIYHCLFFIDDSPSPLYISSYPIAPGMSYLFASTRIGTPFSSSSCSMISNSCLEYSSLSLSAESTTNTTAFVSW